MANEKVFVTRRRVPEAIARLEQHFDVEVWDERTPPPKSVVVEKAGQCQGILSEIDDAIDADVFATTTTLKVLANRAVGMDNVDVAAATRAGIAVSNTPGVLAESCADFAVGLMLCLARNITSSNHSVRNGDWTRFDQMPYLGTDVHGATLGIVGLGGIGTAVARRARGFNMRVLYTSRSPKPEQERSLGVEWRPDLDSLLEESDFVSLHMPLTEETRHLIGAPQLSRMKPTAFLINASRGPTVDTEALYEALQSGTIAGAALDVTDPEPIRADHPLVSMPNVLITPHISSASLATFTNMGLMAADNIVCALTGRPMPSCVNPEVLE